MTVNVLAPHFCQDDHAPIRHWDSEHEQCPLCRAVCALQRAEACIKGLLARTPVRDVAETLAEIDDVLK